MTDAEVFTVGVKPSCTANTAVSHHVIQRSWALMKDFSPLSSVPLTSAQIEEIPPNGRCGWLALGRDRCEGELDYRDLSNLEKSGREVKLEILQGIMTWLGLGDLHDERTSRELTKDEVEGLCSVDVSLGRLPHTSASVRQLLHKMKHPNVWMSLPFCAFASDILGATITVWEPCGDGTHVCLYKNGHTSGFFPISGATNEPIHLLYSGGSRADGKGFLVRDPCVSEQERFIMKVGACNHFDRIYFRSGEVNWNRLGFAQMSSYWNLSTEARLRGSPWKKQPKTAPLKFSSKKPADLRLQSSGSNRTGGNLCGATFASGKRKGQRCSGVQNPPGGGVCSRHVEAASRARKKARTDLKDAGSREGQHGGDSGEEDEGGMENWRGNEAAREAKAAKSADSVMKQANEIEDPYYRECFLRVHELHNAVRLFITFTIYQLTGVC